MIFSEDFTKKDYWVDKVGTWYFPFQDLWESKPMENIMTWLEKERFSKKIYPYHDQMFKAFHECTFGNVKLVMLGSCPFYQAKSGTPYANGLLFDSSNVSFYGQRHLLCNVIETEYERKYPHHFAVHIMDGSMASIAREGVLMLNVALTVEAEVANSHNQMWIPFMRGFLNRLKQQNMKTIPVIAFGKTAQDVCEYIKYPNYVGCTHPGQFIQKPEEWKPFGEVTLFDKMNKLIKKEIEW